MECENATTHRPVILHAKYCWSSSPGTKKWSEIVLAFAFNCVHLHFSGDSCVYGVLNDYPFYFCSKKKEIKSFTSDDGSACVVISPGWRWLGGCNENSITL